MDTTGIIQQLAAAYPHISMSKETIAVYDRALTPVPLGQLQAVVDHAIATSKFLPTIAELKRLRQEMFAMTAEERKRAYCPDSLRGIAIGCDEVFRQRDQMQLSADERRMLEAA